MLLAGLWRLLRRHVALKRVECRLFLSCEPDGGDRGGDTAAGDQEGDQPDDQKQGRSGPEQDRMGAEPRVDS